MRSVLHLAITAAVALLPLTLAAPRLNPNPIPVEWASAFGGTSSDSCSSVAALAGVVASAGFFASSTVTFAGQTYSKISTSDQDGYVALYTEAGAPIKMAHFGGPNSNMDRVSVAFDDDMNVYMCKCQVACWAA